MIRTLDEFFAPAPPEAAKAALATDKAARPAEPAEPVGAYVSPPITITPAKKKKPASIPKKIEPSVPPKQRPPALFEVLEPAVIRITYDMDMWGKDDLYALYQQTLKMHMAGSGSISVIIASSANEAAIMWRVFLREHKLKPACAVSFTDA